jgi:hypothetical protein
MHQKAIQSLAELTSKAMEQFHKAGELILDGLTGVLIKLSIPFV